MERIMNFPALLQQTKERLQLYINAERAILEGAQYYQIGNRNLRRADLKEVRAEIDNLQKQEDEIEAIISGNGSRIITGIIPRDI